MHLNIMTIIWKIIEITVNTPKLPEKAILMASQVREPNAFNALRNTPPMQAPVSYTHLTLPTT